MRLVPVCLRLIALLFTLTLAQAQAPEPRTALVVGNADYSFGALRNPINDAEAVAKSLEEAGFAVTLETDADQAEMQKAIAAFRDALKQKGGVGLFYFAGHGVQMSGENYLLPVGGHIRGESDIKTGAVTATEIVDAMASARNGLNIVVLDACRNNPINKGATRGLSRIDSNESLFVSYSTSPGAVALDGEGGNSPYTKYLATSIATPNLNIEETFKRTLKGVYEETKGEQIPWISSTFFGDFVFRPKDGAAASPDAPPANAGGSPQQEAMVRPLPIPQQAPAEKPELAGIYRVSGTNPNGSQYQGMVALSQQNDDVHAHLVDRQAGVPRHRAFRRQDAGGQLGRQAPGDLHVRRRRRARRRMGRRLGDRDATARRHAPRRRGDPYRGIIQGRGPQCRWQRL